MGRFHLCLYPCRRRILLRVNGMLSMLAWCQKGSIVQPARAFRYCSFSGQSKHLKQGRGYLHSLPSRCDGIAVAEVMKDTLRRDPDALALERGVGVTGRLRGSLADLSSGMEKSRARDNTPESFFIQAGINHRRKHRGEEGRSGPAYVSIRTPHVVEGC